MTRAGPWLTGDEERDLLVHAQAGDRRAQQRLVMAHHGLIVRAAARLRARGCTFDDLLQQGRLGVLLAIRRFDPRRGVRLSTYAGHWIRACMLELVVRTHGPMRVGTTHDSRRLFFGLGRAVERLERRRLPVSPEQIARALGVDVEETMAMLPRLQGGDVSLDDAVRGLPLQSGDDPERAVGEREEAARRRAALAGALGGLPARQRYVVRRRYLASHTATLQQIGDELGLSRERVRQLERAAIAELRAACAGRGE